MDEHAFWRQKIIQFFHDPPAKALASVPGRGGHARVARELFDVFQHFNVEKKLRYWFKPADWAAAGADRPLLYVPREKGVSGIGTVHWKSSPLITHPLTPGYRLRLPLAAATQEAEDAYETDNGEPRDLLAEEAKAAADLAPLLQDWTDAGHLKSGFVAVWRRFHDELGAHRPDDVLWQEIPADSRCPDHAIWDHLKVTTALAFMKDHKMKGKVQDEGAQEPWMLRLSLGPVSAFIAQSRSARDLWISSYLLADLTWSAMEPIAEHYGPDAIVYPDLRGNPRADCWLFGEHRAALPLGANPSSFAAVLPATFVALVPRGGDGYLETIESLAARAAESVNARWQKLAAVVSEWIADEAKPVAGGVAWRRIWQRQTATAPVRVSWTAIPWKPLERIDNADSLRGRALPAQQPPAAEPPAADADAIKDRRRRLMPWLPARTWSHYELARDVYAHARLDYHQMERGFDYAATHHQLRVRHAMRAENDAGPLQAEEPGEKCTLCGIREALRTGDDDGRHLPLGDSRAAAQKFWCDKHLDPDQTGHERLCAVCATKRFLVAADRAPNPVFNRLWAGMDTPDAEMRDRDLKVRVPFPATATIAAQCFIERIANDGRFDAEMDAVVRACRKAGMQRTSFPRALPRLALLSRDGNPTVKQFLEYEAEDVLFPETAQGKAEGKARGEDNPSDWRDLKTAVTQLRQAVTKAKDIPEPEKRFAIIRLDGDEMGKLLLGDQDAIATRWRDVLHPLALERLNRNKHLLEAGWADLLDCKRLMGPSLHAYISRALGHFSHRIVPWVVEREFSGRLIYAGGDDVLCLAPANEAVDLAARLQQLFSAAWVVDTAPQADPWDWRRSGWDRRHDPEQARRRFAVPLPRPGDDRSIMLDTEDQPVAAHAAYDRPEETMRLTGALLPMLGVGASLSAGIAVGHYKTPLSVLLARSKDLLHFAKQPPSEQSSLPEGQWRGRRAVAVGHASRGGEKTRFAMPWGDDPSNRTRSAQSCIRATIDGFKTGTLPGRLPYQLRALGLSAFCGLQRIDAGPLPEEQKRDARERLLWGLFKGCLARPDAASNDVEAAFALWRQGIAIHGRQYHDYTDGLLFCREMTRGGGSGEDA